jgi:hypothetical protein
MTKLIIYSGLGFILGLGFLVISKASMVVSCVLCIAGLTGITYGVYRYVSD